MNVDLVVHFDDGPPGSGDSDFDAFLDRVLGELDALGRDDIDLSASLARRTATFTVFAHGEADPSADELLTAVRTALHAANCRTPGWEKATAKLEAEDVSLIDA